ncbi:DMT family transporter [Lichenibacterium ramalinae]|uniref:DMT family transporter n=1 Tax=Lichenibacterium ramalinae TaxID=2316527 RepID=A0A4Q2RGW3_9HYPH|nr:DMT family transporter [Lichenibacterium ramalinae]RYB07708.1 DMT family transporter [Lichenibacterium ramalinae]
MRQGAAADGGTVLTGIALASCGYSLFSLQDAVVKWLVAGYPVSEILFLRSLVIVGITLAAGGGPRLLRSAARSRNKGPLALRGLLILVAWLLFYSAAARMGLAEITTLYFAAPVIAVSLSALVLKERVGAARWGAVGTGFAGVAVAAGPLGALQPGPAVAALAAAACWGTSTVLVRWIGRTDSTLVQMLSSNAIFVAGSLPPLFWLWRSPDPASLALMLGLGLVGGLGQYLLFEGFRYAPASALAPVEYTGLVWAGVYGYAIWADIPGPGTVAGAALIVAGSLGLVWSERRRAATT